MTEPAIQLENVTFAYPPVLLEGEPVRVLEGVDLVVPSGQFVGIIGPNGVGKTTLLLIMAGLVPRLSRGKLGGVVRVQGRAGMLFQESEGQLFNATVETEVAWGLENLGLPVDEIDHRLNWAIHAMGLDDHRQSAPGALSGGQQKRVALAATLAMYPDVLLLDEPTAGLDPTARRDVLAALADLRELYPVTVVMAENDAETVARFAERVVVLNEGRVARDALPADLYREIPFLDSIGAPVPPAARFAAMLRDTGRAVDFLTLDGAIAALKHDR